MSNFGQAAGAIVGGVIGFFIGGPTGALYGFQLGLLAGSALFPTQLPGVQGPRLGDGQQTVSQVGAPIPAIFGTQNVGGIIIWASPVREVASTETAGGKGGPEQDQTSFTYYRSFAVLLASREPDEGPIAGIRKIKANGKPIFDRTLPEGISLGDVISDATSDLSQQIIGAQAVTSDWASKMTVYLGSEDQMPDPVIESFEGVGNVPAYRGYVYVVFDDVQMKPEDGNRLPGQWSFQIYEEGEEDSLDLGYYASEVLYPWTSSLIDPRDLRNTYGYLANAQAFDNFDDAVNAINSINPDGPAYSVFNHRRTTNPSLTAIENPNNPLSQSFYDQGNNQTSLLLTRYNYGLLWTTEHRPPFNICADEMPYGVWQYGVHFGHGNADFQMKTNLDCSQLNPDRIDGCYGCGNPPNVFYSEQQSIVATRSPSAPPPPCESGVNIPGMAGFCANGGLLYPSVEWQLDVATYHVLQKFVGNTTGTKYPLGPARPVGHADDNETFWTAAYLEAVARGDLPAGLSYGVTYPQLEDHAYKLAMPLTSVETQQVSLASIVRRICNRVSARSAGFEIDVSDLEDKFVVGYQISRQMTARGAIEPLRSVGFFDVVESGIHLKFPTRGKAAVTTLIDDDLGAHLYDEERPSLITTRKAQELELPRQIRVHYQNPQRDFDPGEELSPARFDTDAESVLDIDLSVAIDPDQAAKIAEVIYRDTWASRWVHEIQLDISQAKIESADCVIVPLDGNTQRVRVTSLTDKLPNLRTLSLLRDDDGSYVSTAVGVTSQRPSNSIVLYGPVGLELMDLPPLVLTHNDAGIYAASYPLLSGGAFRGAVISRSIDNGASYSIVGSVTTASPIGHVVLALGDGPTTIFDEAGELRVEMEYGVLESRSEIDVLDGANAAAIGVNGRWEIVQFKTATLIAGKIYALTGLLRGRRGTEYNMGTGVPGDRFVVLDNVARLPMEVSEVGASRLYKAQPIASPQQVNSIELTGHGITLKPFSPVQIEGARDVDGNLTITWVRRDRLADDMAQDETDIVMSEDVQDFEIDILDAEDLRRRTISVSDPIALYSNQMQADDFGAIQSEVTVKVYQISAQVGRGAPRMAVL